MTRLSSRFCILLSTACLLGMVAAPTFAITDTFTFDEFGEGTLLSRQLEARGVLFPGGVIVASQGAFLSARKGIIPLPSGEFAAQRIRIDFTVPQRTVRLLASARQQFGPYPASVYVVKMDAYAVREIFPPGRPPIRLLIKVASTQERIDFFGESGVPGWLGYWPTLAVADAAGIDEIIVYMQKDDVEDNLSLIADNLTIEGDLPPPPPTTDTVYPVVNIIRPSPGEVFDSTHATLSVLAEDDQFLQRVSYTVTDEPSGPVVPGQADVTLCGDGLTGLCPGRLFSSGLRGLDLPRDGSYRLTVTACDSAGNCTASFHGFMVTQPPPPVSVIPGFVEINQGVQGVLSRAPDSGETTDGYSNVHLLPGKPAVVRWYLFGDGGTRAGYSRTMNVAIGYSDGTRRSFDMTPNTGVASITVPQDPGDGNRDFMARWQMRPDPNQTLNFVIPGTLLTRANLLDVNLDGFGSVQFTLAREKLLGLNLIRIVERDGGTGARPTRAQIDSSIINYLKITYPVSDVRVLSERNYSWDGSGGLYYSDHAREGLLHSLWWVFGGDDAPVTLSGPAHTTVLGVVTQLPHACCGGGIAYLGPGENTALTTLFGDTAAQEIGHNIGFVHLSNLHGEDSNDQTWEPSPNPHAIIADSSADFTSRTFGVIPQATTPPGSPGLPYGQWSITVVDPCPGAIAPPCALPDNMMPHEFMSYGSSTTSVLAPLVTQNGDWLSDAMYRRFYVDIANSGAGITASDAIPTLRAVSAQADRVEALLISGTVGDDGQITLSPLLRKPLPTKMLSDPQSGGPYTLVLYGKSGSMLLKQNFELAKLTHSDANMVKLAVPFIQGMERLVIEEGQSIVADISAGPSTPQVKIIAPRNGMVFRSGIHTIVWEASDADNDPLTFLIQYSPDGGTSWQGIDLITETQTAKPRGQNSAVYRTTFDVNELIPGNKGLVRVTASDGFNTTATMTAGAFTVGK